MHKIMHNLERTLENFNKLLAYLLQAFSQQNFLCIFKINLTMT